MERSEKKKCKEHKWINAVETASGNKIIVCSFCDKEMGCPAETEEEAEARRAARRQKIRNTNSRRLPKNAILKGNSIYGKAMCSGCGRFYRTKHIIYYKGERLCFWCKRKTPWQNRNADCLSNWKKPLYY